MPDAQEGTITCGICMDDEIREVGELSSCGHDFCFPCALTWSKNENRCPACRSRFIFITRKQLQPPSPSEEDGLDQLQDELEAVCDATETDEGVPPCIKRRRGITLETVFVDDKRQVWQPEDLIDLDLENVRCQVCGGQDHEALLMLCDGCDKGFHSFCVGLGMSVPEDEWHCRECTEYQVALEEAEAPAAPIGTRGRRRGGTLLDQPRGSRRGGGGGRSLDNHSENEEEEPLTVDDLDDKDVVVIDHPLRSSNQGRGQASGPPQSRLQRGSIQVPGAGQGSGPGASRGRQDGSSTVTARGSRGGLAQRLQAQRAAPRGPHPRAMPSSSPVPIASAADGGGRRRLRRLDEDEGCEGGNGNGGRRGGKRPRLSDCLDEGLEDDLAPLPSSQPLKASQPFPSTLGLDEGLEDDLDSDQGVVGKIREQWQRIRSSNQDDNGEKAFSFPSLRQTDGPLKGRGKGGGGREEGIDPIVSSWAALEAARSLPSRPLHPPPNLSRHLNPPPNPPSNPPLNPRPLVIDLLTPSTRKGSLSPPLQSLPPSGGSSVVILSTPRVGGPVRAGARAGGPVILSTPRVGGVGGHGGNNMGVGGSLAGGGSGRTLSGARAAQASLRREGVWSHLPPSSQQQQPFARHVGSQGELEGRVKGTGHHPVTASTINVPKISSGGGDGPQGVRQGTVWKPLQQPRREAVSQPSLSFADRAREAVSQGIERGGQLRRARETLSSAPSPSSIGDNKFNTWSFRRPQIDDAPSHQHPNLSSISRPNQGSQDKPQMTAGNTIPPSLLAHTFNQAPVPLRDLNKPGLVTTSPSSSADLLPLTQLGSGPISSQGPLTSGSLNSGVNEKQRLGKLVHSLLSPLYHSNAITKEDFKVVAAAATRSLYRASKEDSQGQMDSNEDGRVARVVNEQLERLNKAILM